MPYNTPTGEGNHCKMLWRRIFQPLLCLWISLCENHFLVSHAAIEKEVTHPATNTPTQMSTCHKRNIPWGDHLSWLQHSQQLPCLRLAEFDLHFKCDDKHYAVEVQNRSNTTCIFPFWRETIVYFIAPNSKKTHLRPLNQLSMLCLDDHRRTCT